MIDVGGPFLAGPTFLGRTLIDVIIFRTTLKYSRGDFAITAKARSRGILLLWAAFLHPLEAGDVT